LAQAAIYMACAPKSNASAKAIWSAMDVVKEGRTVEVPVHLRDKNSTVSRTGDGVLRGPRTLASGERAAENLRPGAESAEHGDVPSRKYLYPHDASDGYVVQDYLGVDRIFYEPTEQGVEARIKVRLKELRERIAAERIRAREK
jgi:putative ATPase